MSGWSGSNGRQRRLYAIRCRRLVPEFEKEANGALVIKDGQCQIHDKPRTVNRQIYNVRRYRPRIEGLFARIERWANQKDPADAFWRAPREAPTS